jgi:hypothetical protein
MLSDQYLKESDRHEIWIIQILDLPKKYMSYFEVTYYRSNNTKLKKILSTLGWIDIKVGALVLPEK